MTVTKIFAGRVTRLVCLTGALWVTTNANAAPAQAYLPSSAIGVVYSCAAGAISEVHANSQIATLNKASAILEGQPSALDIISAKQAGEPGSDNTALVGAYEPNYLSDLAICKFGRTSQSGARARTQPAPFRSDEFLGSRLIKIGATPLDDAWRRVSQSRIAAPIDDTVRFSTDAPRLQKVRKINVWVNRNIQFTEDSDLYGQADYWATASETLNARRGDCEDLAILKYQLLLQTGFDPAKMYLTIAWDTIRRRDHAILVLEEDGLFYILDNETNGLLPGDQTLEYTARLSFSKQSSWIHGYSRRSNDLGRADERRLAYFSDNAVSRARVTGFKR